MEWEVRLIEWIQNDLESTGKAAGSLFAFVGGELGLLVLLVVVMFCWKKETGQRMVLMTAAVLTWFAMIKAAAMRPRPYTQYPDRVDALAPADPEAPATDLVAQGYSFPSMHSGSVAALYFTLARDVKKRWFWAAVAALTLLVGISRVVTGNHYPTDVLAGWVLGFAVMGIFELLDRHVRGEWARSLILLAVTLPGVFFVRTSDYFTALGILIGALAAIPFERKYVDYQDTRNIWAMLLRVLGAFVIYFGLNTLLKMPFSDGFLSGASLAAFLVRSARYAVIMFVIMGVYPKAFAAFEKAGKRAGK